MGGRRIRVGIGCALLLVAAAACGTDESGSSASESTPMGHTYISTEVTGDPIPGGGPLTLAFTDGRISADAGCNTHNGPVDIAEHTLTVTNLASTLMACAGDKAGADAWLAGLLKSAPQWRLDGDTLTLTGKSSTVVLRDKKVVRPDRPVRGTEWVVTALLSPEAETRSQALDNAHPTLTLGEDDSLTGSAGCNRLSGRAVVTDTPGGADIAFTPATTRMMCAPEVMEVEHAILTALQGTAHATIDADTLTLRNPNGHGLTLRAT